MAWSLPVENLLPQNSKNEITLKNKVRSEDYGNKYWMHEIKNKSRRPKL